MLRPRRLSLLLACISFVAVAADLQVTQVVASPDPAAAGKDVAFTITVFNAGPEDAMAPLLWNTLPPNADFVWMPPGCEYDGVAMVVCPLGDMPNGATRSLKVIVRPQAAGSITHTAAVDEESDGFPGNNAASLTVTVNPSPPGVAVQRYRLYSPVTLEHHYTTDLNEYTVLGTYAGTWNQEGTVGKVLDNPGEVSGVPAVPYYRLYNTALQWHHWTTDPNEYYTLATYPSWQAEGVDGYILRSQAMGTIALYRLTYPPVPGLHHWTIDAAEVAALTSQYGWVDEGGTGYVIP
ncbi:MAG TPA: hypothetical protein VM122_02095 [Usitatibacter sp.]|nr:hypothetical protein [Usitatibacter sp.]